MLKRKKGTSSIAEKKTKVEACSFLRTLEVIKKGCGAAELGVV
jgi:hypothetical protein